MTPVAPQSSPETTSVVARRFAASSLAVSVAAIGVGLAISSYTWGGTGRPLPMTGRLAALIVAGGVTLLFALRARFCVACSVRLRLAGVRFGCREPLMAVTALRAGDGVGALERLGPPNRRGDTWAELWYCPTCRTVATVRLSRAEAILTGHPAQSLIEQAVSTEIEGVEER